MTVLPPSRRCSIAYTGQDDVAVGSPIANRNRGEIEALIGFFANMLVLRTSLGGDPSFDELLERVRQTAVGAYAHQDLPFEKLVGELRPGRDLRQHAAVPGQLPTAQPAGLPAGAAGPRPATSRPGGPLGEVRLRPRAHR